MAFIFVPLLAVTWIVGLAVVAHAGTYLLSIVESSSTGMAVNVNYKGRSFRDWMRDGVDWPDEPFADSLLKGFFASYLVMLCLAPAMLIGRASMEGPWATVIAGLVFWATFPVVMLSSLASDSRWCPLYPGLFVGAIRRPFSTIRFYLLTLPVLAVLFLTFDLIFIDRSAVANNWAIGLSMVATLAFFVYSRLIGRYGMVLSYAMPEKKTATARSSPKKKRRPPQAYDPKHRWGIPTEEIPNDVPRLISPEGEVEAYGINISGKVVDEAPRPAPIIHKFDDEDDAPIIVADEDELPPSTERDRVTARLVTPTDREMSLYLRERPTEPSAPFGVSTWAFLFDVQTLVPWVRLTGGVVALALLQRALDLTRPI